MGKSVLILHSHLPLVRHPEYKTFLEERWLFEAISETYLPLIRMLRRLDEEEIPSPMAMSFSPTVSFMLQDPMLLERYAAFLDRSIALAEQELERTAGDPAVHPLATMYHDRYTTDREELYSLYDGNILRAFERFARKGSIELLATSATHAFLPNYRHYPEIVQSQVELGVESFTRDFGLTPRGFWLPECGYYEGLDQIIADAGLSYFVSSAHGVLFGDPSPRTGTYSPIETPAGIAAFPRDVYTATWVWSSEQGYPADPVYRDFYRDIGYDLPLDYVRPYIHDGEVRIDTGFKYHAITGPGDDKVVYDPEAAQRRAREHARDFFSRQREHSIRLSEVLPREPVITSPFDTELFGHWWFEGPRWLEEVFRAAHDAARDAVRDAAQTEHSGDSPGTLSMTTPSAYLDEFGTGERVAPTFSSWGSGGYAEVWLDGSNDWIYRHTHQGIERMAELVQRFPDESGLKERALNQAAREVLLAMASDWPFIMNAHTVVTYAERRVKEHLYNFTRIYEALSQRNMGTEWLTWLEKKHPLFPGLDYRRMKLTKNEVLRDLVG